MSEEPKEEIVEEIIHVVSDSLALGLFNSIVHWNTILKEARSTSYCDVCKKLEKEISQTKEDAERHMIKIHRRKVKSSIKSELEQI